MKTCQTLKIWFSMKHLVRSIKCMGEAASCQSSALQIHVQIIVLMEYTWNSFCHSWSSSCDASSRFFCCVFVSAKQPPLYMCKITTTKPQWTWNLHVDIGMCQSLFWVCVWWKVLYPRRAHTHTHAIWYVHNGQRFIHIWKHVRRNPNIQTAKWISCIACLVRCLETNGPILL